MKYVLHPDAAEEHRRQVTYYEAKQPGLGKRYHAEFRKSVHDACDKLVQYQIVYPPNIRRITFKIFKFDLIYREVDGVIQVLAVANHSRRPGYWLQRL